MTDFGITAYGAYIPRLRLDRAAIASAHKWMAPSLRGLAKGVRAFCGWDEDAVTMAVEAARDAIGNGGSEFSAIGFATTNPPYADLQASAIIAGALALPKYIQAVDNGLTQRAGTSGLFAMLKAGEPALYIAADAPNAKPASTQEMVFGAGAAAFALGDQNVAARLVGSASLTRNFVDHFRDERAEYDYHWEERWIRDEGYSKLVPEAVKRALEKAGLEISDIQHFAMASMQRGVGAHIARLIGFEGASVDDLADGCGYAGAAHGPLMLALALENAKPGERIMVAAFGQGVDVLIFEATHLIGEARPRRGVSGSLEDAIVSSDYLKLASFYGAIDLEWGMRSEKNAKTALTEQYRSSGQMEAFNAGKCAACGTVQFPQLQYCVNCHAPSDQFTEVSLRDVPAKVMTSTADWLSYYPSPPLYVGFVQFENGARVQMEIVGVGPEGLDIGTPLDMTFRIKERDNQRGYNRYFWKATPKAAGGKA